TNSSTGPADATYSWDFGDGKTSTAKSPSHVYNKKGVFTVKLTVSSAAGCTEVLTQKDYINVANFTTSFDVPAVICENTPTTFTNTSSPVATNAYWEYDGGYSYYNGIT